MSVGSVIGSPENFTFTFPTSTAPLLKRHNISLVNIGNNHIMNFSRGGLIETKNQLDRAGVRYFGDPDAVEENRVARIEIGGIPFSFVNWSDWTSDKTDHTVAQVRSEAGSGTVVVVYTHWGDEYVPPRESVRQLAHSFVDAGAAIVIGSHPHIVQEIEEYKGRKIYYSLGNFIFDQYWDEAVRTGLLVRVTFDREGVQSIEDLPISLERDRRTCLKNESPGD
jgi:poly-gamma-glutamate synthesis protein (capsule biosynthesis protein)